MKKTIGLIYGGQSFEHEVSKMTAGSIKENIDKDSFDVKEIYIDKEGNFDENLLKNIDVAFLAVHGPNCEDGKLQEFLEKKKICYTGSGVEASKINMDKVLMHEYFKKAGLNVVDYIYFDKNSSTEKIKIGVKKLGLPVFIKPNNTGSSVGISKINSINKLNDALSAAFKYDNRIIVEKAVTSPREFDVAILGNDNLLISGPGEVLTGGLVYSYETKYLKPFSTTTNVKNLTEIEKEEIRKNAEKAFRATGCKGYARVDFFMDTMNKIYINEINTLPGFTKISMFPKLMQLLDISYKELITRIINLALE